MENRQIRHTYNVLAYRLFGKNYSDLGAKDQEYIRKYALDAHEERMKRRAERPTQPTFNIMGGGNVRRKRGNNPFGL
jgi:hypothetical protein